MKRRRFCCVVLTHCSLIGIHNEASEPHIFIQTACKIFTWHVLYTGHSEHTPSGKPAKPVDILVSAWQAACSATNAAVLPLSAHRIDEAPASKTFVHHMNVRQ
eukprot:GHUV01027773.1.p2 GENE.GHUV01027773.1~~GHUV01027773.1.p2  ORF type:complete len:103 (+),score=6.43 GHUV01027773.1:996-1304(+)